MNETKLRFFETAIALIWQSSYASVGVNEICRHAGVTKGSFYHHFDSKADLFYEASEYYWDSLRSDLDYVFSPSFSPVQQLENLIQLIINRQKDQSSECNPVSGCPFFTAAAQSGVGEEKVRLAARHMTEKALTYNLVLIRNLMSEGLLRECSDMDQLARLLYQFIQGLLLFGRVYEDLDIVSTDIRAGICRLIGMDETALESTAKITARTA